MLVALGASTPTLVRAEVDIKEIPAAVDKFLIGVETNVFYRYDMNPYYGTPS